MWAVISAILIYAILRPFLDKKETPDMGGVLESDAPVDVQLEAKRKADAASAEKKVKV
jgi:hypothetical protein